MGHCIRLTDHAICESPLNDCTMMILTRQTHPHGLFLSFTELVNICATRDSH